MLNPQFSIPLWRLDVEGYRRCGWAYRCSDLSPVDLKVMPRAPVLLPAFHGASNDRRGGPLIVGCLQEPLRAFLVAARPDPGGAAGASFVAAARVQRRFRLGRAARRCAGRRVGHTAGQKQSGSGLVIQHDRLAAATLIRRHVRQCSGGGQIGRAVECDPPRQRTGSSWSAQPRSSPSFVMTALRSA